MLDRETHNPRDLLGGARPNHRERRVRRDVPRADGHVVSREEIARVRSHVGGVATRAAAEPYEILKGRHPYEHTGSHL